MIAYALLDVHLNNFSYLRVNLEKNFRILAVKWLQLPSKQWLCTTEMGTRESLMIKIQGLLIQYYTFLNGLLP